MAKPAGGYKGALTKKGYCEILRERLYKMDDNDPIKREVIIELGEKGYKNAYNVLEEYVKTELRHQALISMARLDYERTIELAKKLAADYIKKFDIKNTLECIVTDRIDNVGGDEFLKELEKFERLDDYTRLILYGAIKKGIALTNVSDNKAYLKKVKKILSI